MATKQTPKKQLEKRRATRDTVIPGVGTVQAGWEGEVDVADLRVKPLLTKALVKIEPNLKAVPDKPVTSDK
ncbi:MAG: hypothetical protein ACFB0C_15665 [Leptolyngbyaceae cyanobacterium]